MKFKQWFTQQNDRDLAKRIKGATQFSLSHAERTKTRDFLRSYIRMHPVQGIPSTTSRFSWPLHPYPIIAGVLIFTLAGGSAGAASLAEQALPGDLLYPIKVNVNEEVRAALASTPEEEADIAISRAERRIEELHTLSARGDITHDVRAQIDDRIDEQVHAAEIKTGLADDEEKEHRLVAMLRVHENLVAASEIGGSLEPTVTFEMASTAPEEGVAVESGTPESEIALMSATPATDTATSVADEPQTLEAARTVISAEITSAPKGTAREQKKSEKKPDGGAKNIARQKKTAEQRIDTLENLFERKGKRIEKDVWARAQSELEAARAAYDEGVAFYDDESWGDAAVRFNAAIRIAIDAREFLADSPKTEDRSGREDEDRSDSRGSGRERED